MDVYWDVRAKEKNEKIKQEIKRIVRSQDLNVMILGDFTAHFEDYDERSNENAKILKELVWEMEMVILNGTDKTSGK